MCTCVYEPYSFVSQPLYLPRFTLTRGNLQTKSASSKNPTVVFSEIAYSRCVFLLNYHCLYEVGCVGLTLTSSFYYEPLRLDTTLVITDGQCDCWVIANGRTANVNMRTEQVNIHDNCWTLQCYSNRSFTALLIRVSTGEDKDSHWWFQYCCNLISNPVLILVWPYSSPVLFVLVLITVLISQ